MKKNPSSQSGLFNPRAFMAFTLCCVAALAMAFLGTETQARPADFRASDHQRNCGVGFEQGMR